MHNCIDCCISVANSEHLNHNIGSNTPCTRGNVILNINVANCAGTSSIVPAHIFSDHLHTFSWLDLDNTFMKVKMYKTINSFMNKIVNYLNQRECLFTVFCNLSRPFDCASLTLHVDKIALCGI